MKPSFKAPELMLERRPGPKEEINLVTHSGPPTAESLQMELLRERTLSANLQKEIRFVRRMLADRDAECAALQAELAVIRESWLWRSFGVVRVGIRRIRRRFPGVPSRRSSFRVAPRNIA